MNPKITKRDIIINAAIRTFSRKGYYNSRISDIAEDAKISHGLVYHYFSSKEQILITIFRDSFEEVLEEMSRIDKKKGTALDKLKAVITYTFKVVEHNRDLYKVRIMDVPCIQKFYEPENQLLYNRYFARLADFIKEGQQKGLIIKKGAPLLISHIFHGSVDAVIRQFAYNKEFIYENMSLDLIISQTIDLVFSGFILDTDFHGN
ncbi:MAG: TetR/AcrR family transcriptional regulator [Deltaproteobacteria bacterium]|nr:TetR/AcrR family transcriptional regulator [Deltaproteobacteria bacterium]